MPCGGGVGATCYLMELVGHASQSSTYHCGPMWTRQVAPCFAGGRSIDKALHEKMRTCMKKYWLRLKFDDLCLQQGGRASTVEEEMVLESVPVSHVVRCWGCWAAGGGHSGVVDDSADTANPVTIAIESTNV